MTLIHGTSILVAGAGVLLRGPSGSGKSDLAFRLIEAGQAILVADDQTDLRPADGQLHATCPSKLAGLIEVRGVGILRRPHRTEVTIGLVIDLVSHDEVPRMPDALTTSLEGVKLPHLSLCAFEASATAKVVAAAEGIAAARSKSRIAHA
ncbi:MAG: HPr kinase/phosphatase C-terminal domain-containing protein [Pseudomonadota bacterium]